MNTAIERPLTDTHFDRNGKVGTGRATCGNSLNAKKMSFGSKTPLMARNRATAQGRGPNGARLPLQSAVLVVDDSKTDRRIIGHILTKAGYIVYQSPDGLSALNLLRHTRIDLLLCDVNMPTMNGYELLHRASSIPNFEGTPVIMLSALTQEAYVLRGIEKGVDDYIAKPFSRAVLVDRVSDVLARSRADMARRTSPASLAGSYALKDHGAPVTSSSCGAERTEDSHENTLREARRSVADESTKKRVDKVPAANETAKVTSADTVVANGAPHVEVVSENAFSDKQSSAQSASSTRASASSDAEATPRFNSSNEGQHRRHEHCEPRALPLECKELSKSVLKGRFPSLPDSKEGHCDVLLIANSKNPLMILLKTVIENLCCDLTVFARNKPPRSRAGRNSYDLIIFEVTSDEVCKNTNLDKELLDFGLFPSEKVVQFCVESDVFINANGHENSSSPRESRNTAGGNTETTQSSLERCWAPQRLLMLPRDIEDLRHQVARTAEDKKARTWLLSHLRRDASNMPLGRITVLDRNLAGRPLVFMDKSFLAFTHYTEEDLIGQPLSVLEGPGTNRHTAKQIAESIEEGLDMSAVIQYYKKTGEPFWDFVQLKAVNDPMGHVFRMVAVHRAIDQTQLGNDGEGMKLGILEEKESAPFGPEREGSREASSHRRSSKSDQRATLLDRKYAKVRTRRSEVDVNAEAVGMDRSPSTTGQVNGDGVSYRLGEESRNEMSSLSVASSMSSVAENGGVRRERSCSDVFPHTSWQGDGFSRELCDMDDKMTLLKQERARNEYLCRQMEALQSSCMQLARQYQGMVQINDELTAKYKSLLREAADHGYIPCFYRPENSSDLKLGPAIRTGADRRDPGPSINSATGRLDHRSGTETQKRLVGLKFGKRRAHTSAASTIPREFAGLFVEPPFLKVPLDGALKSKFGYVVSEFFGLPEFLSPLLLEYMRDLLGNVAYSPGISYENFVVIWREHFEKESSQRSIWKLLMTNQGFRKGRINKDRLGRMVNALVEFHPELRSIRSDERMKDLYICACTSSIIFSFSRARRDYLSWSDFCNARLGEILSRASVSPIENLYPFSVKHNSFLIETFTEMDWDQAGLIDIEAIRSLDKKVLCDFVLRKVFSGVPRTLSQPEMMNFEDFAWFSAAVSDKMSEPSVAYWFACIDDNQDGYICAHDLRVCYDERRRERDLRFQADAEENFECFVQQICDIVRPASPDFISPRDIIRSRSGEILFDVLLGKEGSGWSNALVRRTLVEEGRGRSSKRR